MQQTYKAVLFLGSGKIMRSVYFSDIKTLVENNFATEYSVAGQLDVPYDGTDACEEWFDLTNNPYRQTEREEKYGRGRSVSVGDIILVNERMYVCAPSGWVILG